MTPVDFQNTWNLEMAMTVLASDTIDGSTWSEAVKWLLLHGPEELREMLLQAAGCATREHFPDLQATAFTGTGEPCYRIEDLARALEVSRAEALETVAELEAEHGTRQLFTEEETAKLQ